MIVIVADADFVLSATEVAVTVTVLPPGMAEGAVYIVVALFPVEVVGLKLPHVELAHLTVQVTPAAISSPLTSAVRVALVLVATDVGGLNMVTEMSEGVVIVTEADADFVVSADEVAVIVTLFPVGTVAGAV